MYNVSVCFFVLLNLPLRVHYGKDQTEVDTNILVKVKCSFSRS